jgi:hypothetical protein
MKPCARMGSTGEPLRLHGILAADDHVEPSIRRGAMHRAAMYTVRVREKWQRDVQPRLLGDIDGAGTSLAAVLDGFMRNFESYTDDRARVVRSLSSVIDGQELRLMLQHGSTGVAGDIVDKNNRLKTHQLPDDTQLLRCGSLFLLPPTQTMGWLAAHVNYGRGVKGLLTKGVIGRFREAHTDLVLEVTPIVAEGALREAVRQNKVDKVKLVRTERPRDIANRAISKWVPGNAIGKLELDISVRGEGPHIITRLLSQFLGGRSEVFDQIVEFQGLRFDEAKVEVTLETGRRTFNIESPDSGHAITQDLSVDVDDETGEPKEDSLFKALRGAITDVTGES